MRRKTGFSSLSAKDEIVYKIGVIAALENINMYEVIEMSVKETFPEYFGPDDGVLAMVEQV